ncbi:MAG: LptF/LptG family permease [Armatimonadota bacterium]|nr:LptF/LptG family permease [Armatimonadota bacterium]MDR7445261.1 LptF/LptG family permease [Armatimonadota bacterium]MDR7614763.1 LptF/LptG family permease [Armatimonadota bacterium]
MPSLLDRYVARELLSPFLAGVFAFLVILIGDILYVLAEYLARGQVPLWALLRLFFYKLPHMLVITFPVATLLGTLLGIGRLTKDGEIIALRMAGLPLTRIFLPVMGFGLVVSVLSFGVNEYLTPLANRKADELVRRTIFREVFPNIKQDVFFRGPQNRYFYVRQVDYTNRTLQGVMVYELGGAFPRLITAQRATFGEGVWVLEQGVIRELDRNGFTSYEAGFQRFELRVDVDAEGFLLQQKTPDEMSASELRQHLQQLRQSGVDPQPLAVDYYFKFAAPLAALIFAFMAAPLGLVAARGGHYTGVGAAIALVFVYYAVMSTARAWAKAGTLHPFLGAWAANLAFLAGGALLYLYTEGLLRGRRAQAAPPISPQPAEAG